jgi:H/ACA ribonucleoprotein complex subunit 3
MSLHKCIKCGKYTLQETCSKCNEQAVKPAPPRFSIEHAQKYGKYRREALKRFQQKESK